MLLIHDHQAETLESNVAGQELVRADNDVNGAVRQPGSHFAHAPGASEARQQLHPNGPGAEAVRERTVVLLGEQRGGRQQGRLVAGLSRDEGGAQRHLRLAESHVPADHPIHRPVARQVIDDVVDGADLVVGFPKRKLQGEALIHVLGQTEGDAPPRGPPGVEIQQFRRRVPRLLRRLALRLEPLVRAQAVQRRLLRRRARVAAGQVQAVNGYVELVRIRVFQHQELGHRPVHFEILQTPVAPDAVLFVHHRGADAQVSQVADDGFRVTRRTPSPAALPGPVEAQLPGGDHAQGRLGQDQPRVQVPDPQGQRSFAVQKVLPALHPQWV